MNVRTKKYVPYILLGIIGLIVLFSAIRNSYYEHILNGKTKRCIGIITHITNGTGVRQISGVDFYYFVNGNRYENNDNGDFNFMKLGDTILIEYAIEDHSIARVADKYYMKKYKYLQKDEIVR